jgi:chromosome segregation and condensation protein ScpB
MMPAGSRTKRKSAGQAAVNAHAVRAVVQILFATGKAYTIETLREKLREFFVGEGDSEKRAVAALSTVQLITALLEASPALESLGLQIRLTNGTAQMITGRIQNEMLSAFITERVPASSGVGDLTQAALEVLACIAFKQPISQGEIDQIFGETECGNWTDLFTKLRVNLGTVCATSSSRRGERVRQLDRPLRAAGVGRADFFIGVNG